MNKVTIACGCVIAAMLLAVGVETAHAVDKQTKLEPESPTLNRIVSSGVVNIGYIPSPGTFAFIGPHGQTTGYSIELCSHVVDALRARLKRPDLRVNYHPLAAAQRIPKMTTGAIDMECSSSTNTLARQRDVDFSYTIFIAGVRMLARANIDLQGASTLWRQRIAVAKGTTAYDIITRLQDEQQLTCIVVATDLEGLHMVERGEADAYAQDDVLLYGLAAQSPMRTQLHITGKFFSVEPYALMLPKGDSGFREVVDSTLMGLMRDGSLKAAYDRWFDTIPMSVYMQENIRFPNRYGM